MIYKEADTTTNFTPYGTLSKTDLKKIKDLIRDIDVNGQGWILNRFYMKEIKRQRPDLICEYEPEYILYKFRISR